MTTLSENKINNDKENKDNCVYISHFSALKHWDLPLVKQYYQDIIDSIKIYEVLIRSRKVNHAKNGVKTYLNRKHVPQNGLMTVNNKKIVSPYLLFLQLSENMDILETILMGNLFCSKYDGPFSQECLDVVKLRKFVEAAKGHKGRQKAMRALQYVQNGACSIMEILYICSLAYRLCLEESN